MSSIPSLTPSSSSVPLSPVASSDVATSAPSDVTGSNSNASSTSSTVEAFWDLDRDPLDAWVRTVPALFPVLDTGTPKSDKNGGRSTASITDNQETVQQIAISTTLWKNLQLALDGLQSIEEPLNNNENNNKNDDDEDDSNGPPSKRIKTENGASSASNHEYPKQRFSRKNPQQIQPKKKKKRTMKVSILDPYNVWLHTLRKYNQENADDPGQGNGNEPVVDEGELEAQLEEYENAAEEIKTSMGGKLSQLGVSGILNGMSGRMGGVVRTRQCEVIPGSIDSKTGTIDTAHNITFSRLKHMATAFYNAIQTRIEADVLVTTPIRIQQMLAPDVLPHEFKAIRRRIYDTVILGKGLANPAGNDNSDIPTAASGGVHDIEKFKKCKSCGNNDQSAFVLDRKNGDVICSACGTVVSESLMHEGSQFRKFEGEVDRNHHGDTANPLYSNAHNMSTTLGGVQITTGAGIGGYGSQAKRGLETVLRNAHAFTELNISQFGKGDRRTRTGYKDKQKKDAFIQMTHCGDALNLHEAVVQRAKELFAGFRDDRELVQQFKGVIAACLCEAFDQLSTAGKQILKQKAEDPVTSAAAAEEKKFAQNSRASRRNELHHANLAGKGGLLLDFSAVPSHSRGGKTPEVSASAGTATPPPSSASGTASSPPSTVSEKLAASWDLDDCRSWLLEASRSIAQQWMEEGNNGLNKKIPKGTLEELEGRLVEHAITLCDQLELDLQKKNEAADKGKGKRGVVTPRVRDMAKLGIKWQHAHERGSGGKGGVGNNSQHNGRQRQPNAANASAIAVAPSSGRTAGQILILKTAKKLGSMLNDPVAGEAIHKELRALVGRQEARKRKEMREEATRQRFLQMKRKPWLQARAQIET